MKTFAKEVQRQKHVARKARAAEMRLVFVANALKRLFADENFVNLLQAEKLDNLPEYVADSDSEGHVSAPPKVAFERETVRLPLAKILPTRALPTVPAQGSAYQDDRGVAPRGGRHRTT